jgi:hypothetical protein
VVFVSHLFFLTYFNPFGLGALPVVAGLALGSVIAGTGLSPVAGAIPGVP